MYSNRKLKNLLIWSMLAGNLALVHAQDRNIQGKVRDANTGELLGNVTISVKGSKQSLQTKPDGTFVLPTNPNAILVITSTGYQSVEVKVGQGESLDIKMESSNQQIDEVVVVGYGKMKRSNLTGSVSRLDKKVLETGVRSNPASALAGTIPGIRVQQTSGRPGSVPSVTLRGGTSYAGGGNPLVIVDGLIRSGFNDINQNDIESIDVLKDASATAIYGARAANGVVLITTKKGKEGVSNVTLQSKVGINTLNSPFKFLNARDFLEWSRKGVQLSGQYQPSQLDQLTKVLPFGTGNLYKDENGNILDGNVTSNAVWSTMFLDDTNRELLQQGWQTMIDPVTGKELIFKDFNYADYALRDFSLTQDYNVAVQGGNDKGKYYGSVGKYNEKGMPISSFYDRTTFVLNGDYKIKPWLQSFSGVNFAYTKWRDAINGEGNYMTRALGAPPTMRGVNANGELLVGKDWQDGNPAVNDDKFVRNNINQKLTLSQAFTINFLENLNLRVSGNWFFNQSTAESFNKDYLASPGNYVRTRNSSASYDKIYNQTYNAVLNYNTKFDEDHHIDAMVGWEFFDAYNNGFSASGSGAPTDDFMDLGLTSPEANKRSIDSYHDRQRINSFFGRINYDYKEKYLMTLTARRDGYSTLLNNRWGTFPGVSLGWALHKEDFLKDYLGTDHVVNSLKLRASYGANGNVSGIGSYTLQGSYGTNKYDGQVGYAMSSLSIPNLKWESLMTKEVGLETRLLNRLDLTLAYYHRTTKDKIANLTLPASAGFTTITTNNGDMQNQGVEIDLNYQLLRKSDWDVNLSWNTAYNKNKILKLPYNGVENNRQGGLQVYDSKTKELVWVGGYQEGQDPNVAYAYEATGIIRSQQDLDNYALKLKDLIGARTLVHPDAFNALPDNQKNLYYPLALGDVMWKDVNGDGIINSYDRVYMGNTVPKWTGGFGVSVRWKDVSLSSRFDYALGYVAYDGPRAWFLGMMQGTFNTTTDVFNTWTPENPNAQYPAYYWADQLFKNNTSRESSMFYNKGNYLAFRELTVGYKLPKTLANRIKMEDLNVSLTGQNLHYWTKNTLFSAESGSVGQGGGGYPLPRTFILGLQLTF
ncbi:SusC/RagA family TonB-linked outer membrane protein [Sphingobacterium faecium]|uniref:SusC/RagA family TonB-linked outer membrane protein n=1 Tax=Sphingobacterium faecium TaxID=34087 RepID=UPI0024688733|nr:SusC/RagA family TonB-linked outer membrane protein [Sphingobacterium faecium]MDH5826209.1 SusC/RagA family TonB-linked outer membrane protein [Sphingobacterium faecium]